MCKFCENDKSNYTEYLCEYGDDTVQIHKLKDNKYEINIDVLVEGVGYYCISFPIEFCPKCGRKLGGLNE
jgi:hypothetical protein